MNEPVAVTAPANTAPAATEPAVAAVADVIASNDATTSDVNPGTPVGDVGDLLRAAREKMGLSANDIAAKLRMGVKQIQALEAGDYAALPKGTFLRGFVRNYARQVSLNGDEVISLLEKTHSGASLVSATPEVEPAQQNIRVQRPGGELATPKARALGTVAFILILGAVAWYWWEFMRSGRPVDAAAAPVAQTTRVSQPVITPSAPAAEPVVAVADSTSTANPPTVPAGDAVKTAAPASPSSAPAVAAVAGPAPAPVAAPNPAPRSPTENAAPVAAKPVAQTAPPGSSTLGFTFSGESWVEVTDANGRILVSRRFKAGDAEEIFGRGPLSVVIGNAQATRMASNGREFDLAPHTRTSVARVTVK